MIEIVYRLTFSDVDKAALKFDKSQVCYILIRYSSLPNKRILSSRLQTKDINVEKICAESGEKCK